MLENFSLADSPSTLATIAAQLPAKIEDLQADIFNVSRAWASVVWPTQLTSSSQVTSTRRFAPHTKQ